MPTKQLTVSPVQSLLQGNLNYTNFLGLFTYQSTQR
jgi:hypothetical protein